MTGKLKRPLASAPAAVSPPAPLPVRFAPATNPAQKIGIFLALIEIFILCSRFFDLFFSGYRLPMVVIVLLIAVSIATGGVFRAFQSPITLLIIAYTSWMVLTIPFSIWRTGSLTTISSNVYATIVFVCLAGLPVVFKDSVQCLRGIGASAVIAALLGIFFGSSETGRLALPLGNFKDPNEYSLMLLMGLPFLFINSEKAGVLNVRKIFGLMGSALILLTFLKTGSRGGMLAFMVLLLLWFWGANGAQKVLIAAAGLMIFAGAIVLLPNYIQRRYLSLAQPVRSSEDAPETLAEAKTLDQLSADADSAESRWQTLTNSIRVSALHPLFGVGPGNFPTFIYDEAKSHNRRAAWLVTHNTYTQLSSETGLPGLFLLLAIIYSCLKAVNSILKASPHGPVYPPHVMQTAFVLRICILSVSVGCFFLSMAYTPIFYILAAMSTALQRTAREEFAHYVPPAPRPAIIPRPRVVLPKTPLRSSA